MNKVIFFLALILIGNHSFGQTISADLLFSHEIESSIAQNKLSSSLASANYSYIGNYRSAIQNADISVSFGVDTLQLEEVALGDAFEKIIETAKDQQIVIISESHYKPQHRIFAKQIIEALAKYDFKHLGMETLQTDYSNENQLLDIDLIKRGYPLASFLTGFYTLEPQMGNLVRSAISNDYQIFGYERAKKIPGKDREEIQADNVIQYINNTKAKKIILLCGWHHAIESDNLKRKKFFYMAKYIKEKTGIDPLTIYQDNFTEKSYRDEHPILQKLNIQTPKVFMDGDKIKRISKEVDIEVIHPKTNYKNNRPDWLYQTSEYQTHKIDPDSITINYPVFVKAFLETDGLDAVPVDIIELRHQYESKALVLPRGKYKVIITNKVDEIKMSIAIK